VADAAAGFWQVALGADSGGVDVIVDVAVARDSAGATGSLCFRMIPLSSVGSGAVPVVAVADVVGDDNNNVGAAAVGLATGDDDEELATTEEVAVIGRVGGTVTEADSLCELGIDVDDTVWAVVDGC
jgi:hypothetical protein